jgi:hypothetical protein
MAGGSGRVAVAGGLEQINEEVIVEPNCSAAPVAFGYSWESPDRRPLMMNPETASWRETAKQASAETDPKKLMGLIDQLCREIDQQVQPTAPQFMPRWL